MFKNTLKYFSRSGFSLIEVMIVMGLMGIVSLGIAQMMKNMFKGQKTLSYSANVAEILTTTKLSLVQELGCGRSFANSEGLQVGSVPDGTFAGGGGTDVTNIYSGGTISRVILTSNPAGDANLYGKGSGGSVRVTKINISGVLAGEPVSLLPVDAIVTIEFTKNIAVSSKTSYGPRVFYRKIPIKVVREGGVTGRKVTSCYTAADMYVAASCTSLGGEMSGSDCTDLNVVQGVLGPAITSEGDFHVKGTSLLDGVITFGSTVYGPNRFSLIEKSTGVSATTPAPFSELNADSFHTNGLGKGQIYMQGSNIDANTNINIGKGIAGNQTAKKVLVSDLEASDTLNVLGQTTLDNNPSTILNNASPALIINGVARLSATLSAINNDGTGLDANERNLVTVGWVKDKIARTLAPAGSDIAIIAQDILDHVANTGDGQATLAIKKSACENTFLGNSSVGATNPGNWSAATKACSFLDCSGRDCVNITLSGRLQAGEVQAGSICIAGAGCMTSIPNVTCTGKTVLVAIHNGVATCASKW